jgi:aspartate-semialdehyde dehydrogenase
LVSVAILGATGAVGQELLHLLDRRGWQISELQALASERSAGRTISFRDRTLAVQVASESSFEGIDVAFFSAGASRSRQFAAVALSSGAWVVDNSSAFRVDSAVPLVVPEVNGDAIGAGPRLIANPNCTATILCMAVAPLRALGRIERLVVSTYQSASGAGWQAMQELRDQTRDVLEGRPASPRVMPHTYAFNLFSHNSPVNDQGYNEEEWKVMYETRRILDMPDLRVGVTCVRVPVLRAHSESVTVEFSGEAPAEEDVRDALRRFPGVRLVDDRAANVFPMPLCAAHQDDVLVGRIRRDVSHPSAIAMFVVGDQLRKGAALNAVQIAERALGSC